jgi:hypothetical protein
MQFHGNHLWTLAYPLRFFGMHLGRRVSVMRLPDGRLVIHSTGPFSGKEIREINALGRVDLMLDATTMHDTFSREAQAAFPDATYLVPEGFSRKVLSATTRSLSELDSLTGGEVQTIRLEGMRYLNETACFHAASRTLFLCDLLFNLDQATGWTRFSMRYLMGVDQWPAIDRPVRLAVSNKTAFKDSLRRILSWDFDRIIVAHGSILETDGKHQFREALQRAGYGGL